MSQHLVPRPTRAAAAFPLKSVVGAAAFAFAAATVSLAAVAHAQPAAAAEARQAYDIPAGPLEQALSRFARATGLIVAFTPERVADRGSPGLQGEFTVAEALSTLLDGTGLAAAQTGEGRYTLEPLASGAALPPDDDDAIRLDAIIVRGEKFSRDRFDTFTSVATVTAEDLDDYVRPLLDQALNSSPNVRVFKNGGDTNIVIRGINAEGPTQPNRSDPVISVIVDGAEQNYEATRAGTRGVWDVEQIEVLRGPQSTLQGRNAMAGSVVIKTKDPTFTPEAIIRGSVDTGAGDMYSGAFALSGPVVEDQLAFRLSGQVIGGENDIRYGDPGYASKGDDEFEQFRGKLLFMPSGLPGSSALFTASHTHDRPAHNLVLGPDYFDRRYSGTAEEFRDTTVDRYITDLKYEFASDLTLRSTTAYVDTTVDIDTPDGQTGWWRDETRAIEDLSQDVNLTFGSGESAFSGVVGFHGAGPATTPRAGRITICSGPAPRFRSRFWSAGPGTPPWRCTRTADTGSPIAGPCWQGRG